MKKKIALIGTAVLSAVLSTLCCIPAFLFLFFGVSASGLSFLIELDFLRIPFAILTFLLLIGIYKQDKEKFIFCNTKLKNRRIFLNIGISLVVLFILFYPELLNYIVE